MKKPSEKWADDGTDDNTPNEKFDDAGFAWITFLPSDFGVKEIGKNGGEDVGDNAVKPKELVGVHNNASEKSVNYKIKES